MDDFLDIEIDIDDFKEFEIINTVNSIRKRLKDLGIDFVTVGRFKDQVHIYLRDLSIQQDILTLLSDKEKQYVVFDKI